MGMAAYCLARKPPSHALVVTHHSDIVRQSNLRRTFEPIFRRVMSRADAIIVTSQSYLDTSEELRPYRGKCVVIPYGIEPVPVHGVDRARVAELRARHGQRVILGVGRLIYYKGFDTLIEAMQSVDGTLVLVGDGPLRAQLERKAASIGVAERVAFVGEVHNKEMAPYYAAADIFAFPSVARSEAFGIVQLEAMLAGLPVVNTKLDSGVPDVSVDGLTGITVAPGDPRVLADALRSLLSNPGLRQRYGEAGRKRVEERFSANSMATQTMRLYEEVLERSRAIVPAA
jgi:rhamnosyl/mannosyltransferase